MLLSENFFQVSMCVIVLEEVVKLRQTYGGYYFVYICVGYHIENYLYF